MRRLLMYGSAVLLLTSPSWGATLDASYFFQNTLNAQQSGAPALTAIDPTGTSGFVSDPTLGRTVYNFSGSTTPTDQGGLSVNTSTILPTNNSYSVEMYFQFFDRNSAYRRILDAQQRQADSGLYVDPSNRLQVYPESDGGNTFTNNAYHDVTLTDNSGTVKAYLDGNLSLTITTTDTDITGNTLNFFLDNLIGGGIGEYSTGDIAALRLYDGVLTDAQVAALAADPLAGSGNSMSGVPEPATWLLMGVGLLVAAGVRRKNTSRD